MTVDFSRPRLVSANGSAPPSEFYDDAPPATPANSWDACPLDVPSEWYTTAPAKRSWLLRDTRTQRADGCLPLGKVGQFVAAGGIGKTMALLQLALSVATGTGWLNTFSVPDPGRVLLLLGEEEADEVHRRLYNASREQTVHPEPGSIVVLPLAGVPCGLLERDERGNTTETAFLHWLRSYLCPAKPGDPSPYKLIVVDPLSRFAGPDAETDNACGTRFVQACESLAALTGATVLFSHHTNKLADPATGRGGRGSSSIFDGCRWECALTTKRTALPDPDAAERLRETVTLTFTKSNYSRKAEPLLLRRGPGGQLVPLDDADLALLGEASGGASKTLARAQEREARAKDAQRLLDERELSRAAKLAERCKDDDRAALELRRAYPETNFTELRKRLKAILGCGTGRAESALYRLSALSGPAAPESPGPT